MINGDPEWVNPGAARASGLAPAPGSVDRGATTSWENPASSSAAGAASTASLAPSSKSSTVQKLLSIAVVLICGLLIAVAVLGMIAFNPKDVSNYSDLFVSVYMVLFGALLLTYEFMWWISVPAINKSLRKNFGFLYGVLGKSIFIIFVAFLNFGLQKQVTVKYLTVGTGIAWFVVAGLHIFLYFWKPQLFGTYHAPAAGLDSPV